MATGPSLSNEIEQVIPFEKSLTLASEERISPTTITTKVLNIRSFHLVSNPYNLGTDHGRHQCSCFSEYRCFRNKGNGNILFSSILNLLSFFQIELIPAVGHHENSEDIVQELMNNITQIISSRPETKDRVSEDPAALQPLTIEVR